VAELYGKGVKRLSLAFDGVTNYTAAFTGLKETYRKFAEITTLSLKVLSGANCRQFMDYLE
jgi:hypothetical protein